VSTTAASPGWRLSGCWMFGPLQDLFLVLLTPVLILFVFAIASSASWLDGLIAFGLAFAVAHYLPGILRAYGDHALWNRYRIRLIIAPVLLFGISAWFAYRDLHIVILMQMLWGGWHWMMQIYGFARIYDAKMTPAARTPARLDQMLCLLWFGMCVFVLSDMSSYVQKFYESGGPFISPANLLWVQRIWIAVTLIVTLVYVVRVVQSIRQEKWPNPLKLVFIALTFVYLSYTASIIDRPVIGLVMFESWHDVQYLAIVWFFNISRARSDDAGRFIRFLFRPRWILVFIYVALCLAFGVMTHAWKLFEDPTIARIAISIVTATALLHYYLDGFIWKIRERETGRALGVQATTDSPQPASSVVPYRVPAWAFHAAAWMVFVIPAATFFSLESRRAGTLDIYQNIVDSFPESARSHYELGRQLHAAGRLREARLQFDKSLVLAPSMLAPHISLGMLLAEQGDFASGIAHLEEVLRVDSNYAEAHNNLGVILEEQGKLQEAKQHLEQAVKLNSGDALFQNNLGRVLAALGDLKGARIHHERAIKLDAQFADAHYQLGNTLALSGETTAAQQHLMEAIGIDPDLAEAYSKLGEIASVTGDVAKAIEYLEHALRIDPELYVAHDLLGGVLLSQGKSSDAIVHYQEALRIKPDYEKAQQDLAKALTR
jgi:tetratricopeptide (TPR) repeat protein